MQSSNPLYLITWFLVQFVDTKIFVIFCKILIDQFKIKVFTPLLNTRLINNKFLQKHLKQLFFSMGGGGGGGLHTYQTIQIFQIIINSFKKDSKIYAIWRQKSDLKLNKFNKYLKFKVKNKINFWVGNVEFFK